MPRLHLLVFLVAATFLAAQDSKPEYLTADAIMARLAANQDRSETLRKQYVYRQHIHILTHKAKGRIQREETVWFPATFRD
jgi:hypothetical protein